MFEPLPLPPDLPDEIKQKVVSMSPSEAAAWIALNTDEARAASAHNSALASMSEAEQEIARTFGMSPETYVKYRGPRNE